MTSWRNQIVEAAVGLALSISGGAVHAGDLGIEVGKIRNNNGKLQIAVFDKPTAYADESIHEAFAALSISAQDGTQTITLHDVPSGRYAVVLFHDENSNDELDTSFTGMPLEGYGISNARDKFDEPDYNRAAVTIGETDRVISIGMTYLGE